MNNFKRIATDEDLLLEFEMLLRQKGRQSYNPQELEDFKRAYRTGNTYVFGSERILPQGKQYTLIDFLIMNGMKTLSNRAHKDAISMGWYDKGKVKSDLESLAMIHSEVSEAIEELRKGELDLYRVPDSSSPDKPEGLVVELADVVIRCADLAAYLGLDLGKAIVDKLNYNLTRGTRHGNKPF